MAILSLQKNLPLLEQYLSKVRTTPPNFKVTRAVGNLTIQPFSILKTEVGSVLKVQGCASIEGEIQIKGEIQENQEVFRVESTCINVASTFSITGDGAECLTEYQGMV
jgi:hypothetical protein